MAVMGISQALKLQKGSLQSIAQLPQDELIRMVQSQEIPQTLLPIILDVKAQMARDNANRQALMARNAQGQPATITERNMATNAQAEAQPQANIGIATAPIREDMYNEQTMAGGGIVAFDDGGEVPRFQNRGYVEPTFSEMIRKRETGGYRGDPNLAVSPKGAMGIMQIMPSTAMQPGYGVPTVFDIADQLGVSYKDKSKASAEKLLTDPNVNKTFGDLYAGAMLQKFEGNPRLAAAAYNAGPGAVERAGDVPNIPETQRYVAGISPERFESARKSVQEARREQLGLPPAPAAVPPAQPIPGAAEAIDRVTDITKRGVAEDNQRLFSDILYGNVPVPKRVNPNDPLLKKEAPPPATAKAETKPETAPPPTPESPFADFRKYIEGQEASLKSQRDEDRAMSILAAGLGILGGTSPYAMANIGQGALQGVALSSKLAEQRAAKEKNLLAARLGLTEADVKEKYYTGSLAAKDVANRIAAGRLGATMQRNLIAARKQFIEERGPDKLAAEYERMYGKKWQNDPNYVKSYNDAINAQIKEIAGGLSLGKSSVRTAEELEDLEP